MGRYKSKLENIVEANLKLEKRVLNEQSTISSVDSKKQEWEGDKKPLVGPIIGKTYKLRVAMRNAIPSKIIDIDAKVNSIVKTFNKVGKEDNQKYLYTIDWDFGKNDKYFAQITNQNVNCDSIAKYLGTKVEFVNQHPNLGIENSDYAIYYPENFIKDLKSTIGCK